MKETCYTFVYNGVQFIGLDSTKGAYEFRGEGEIAEWLEKVLKNNESRYLDIRRQNSDVASD